MREAKNYFLNRKSVQIAYFKAYKGHIHNPGMGIIAMAVSDHMVIGYSEADRAAEDAKPPFSLTREMLQEVTALPYIDNIYIRVGWNDVQKEQGKLCLSPSFEMAVEEAKRAGKSWGFRIMQCSPSNPVKHLLPDFLADKLLTAPVYYDLTYGPRPKLMPLYTDEYLKYWNEMLQLLGEKFDGDPDLEYGDISGYGYWGEGHHGGEIPDSPERTEFVIQSLLNSHLHAFPKTPMVMNLHMAEFYDAGRRMLDKGSWVRRDCYYGWFQAYHAQDGLNRRSDAAMIFETIMPGLCMQDSSDPSYRHSQFDTADAMCDFGANYATVGFNPQDTLYADHMLPQLFAPFQERLGYRLRPSIVWKIKNGDDWSLVLGMVNDGCANPPGELTFYAESNGTKASVTVNGGQFANRMKLVEIPLEKEHDDRIKLTMSLKIGEKSYPVRFAADVRQEKAPYELWVDLRHE